MSETLRTVALAMLLAGVGYGQLNVGRIVGTIRDPSGSVIVGASITARHEVTAVEAKVLSGADGTYAFPPLSVGEYTVTVGFTGFRTAQRDAVRVVAGQTLTLDFDLIVGETTQITTVTAEVPLVDAKSTAIGTTRTVEEIKDLPLQMSGQGRNYLGFLLTLPGISYRPSKSWAAYDGLSRAVIQGVGVAGFQHNVFSYNLDGVSGVSFSNAGLEDAAAPIPEVVEEFRMTTNFNAESGANLGVGFDLVMKSGTNELHGSLFHYLRNDKLDARNWFASSVSAQKLNQYGVVVGGPVVLPKLYDGRNRTFFFASWDGFRMRNEPAGLVRSVPTARMRDGDFGELLGSPIGSDALGRPVLRGQVYDPLTSRPGGGSFVRDPFPNNLLPASRLSSISLAFQRHLPLPNLPGTQLNWVGTEAPRHTDHDRFSFKLDQQITDKHRLTFAGEFLPNKYINFEGPFAPEIRSAEIVVQTIDRYRITYSWIAHANLIFNLRTSYTRGVWDSGTRGTPGATYGATAGLKGVFAPYTPSTSIENSASFGSSYYQFLRIGTGVPVNTDLAWTKGKHNYKFGAEFLQQIMTNTASTNSAGVYTFRERSTGSPNLAGSGAGYASFLLGEVDTASLSTLRGVKSTSRRWGFYAQDQWRINPKLTINYGLRYDLVEPLQEAYRRFGSFDRTRPNSRVGGRPGALTFWGPGEGRNGRVGVYEMYYGAWGPRLGIAYAFNEKTTVRLYYGLVYSPLNADYVQGESIPNYGWAATVATSSLDNGITPAFNWNNGFPPIIPILPNLDPGHLNGTAVSLVGETKRAARSQNMGFSVERMLPGQFVVKAEYVGKLTHGLRGAPLPVNQLDLRYLPLGNLLNASIDSPEASAAGISLPYVGFSGTVAQALRPYPQFQDISEADSTSGFTTYHSLELTAQKRMKGMTILLAYTNSKLLGYGAFQHLALLKTRKALVSPDRPQSLNLSYTWDLPFGPGQRFWNGTSPLLRQVVGGWQVAAIHNYFRGFPVAVSSRATIPGIGSVWPKRVPGAPIQTGVGCSDFDPGNPNRNRFLNIGAFATPGPFTFGDARTLPSTRDCGYLNENLTILKNFPIKERIRLRFGAEIFNLFNRHQWQNLNADIDNLRPLVYTPRRAILEAFSFNSSWNSEVYTAYF